MHGAPLLAVLLLLEQLLLARDVAAVAPAWPKGALLALGNPVTAARQHGSTLESWTIVPSSLWPASGRLSEGHKTRRARFAVTSLRRALIVSRASTLV